MMKEKLTPVQRRLLETLQDFELWRIPPYPVLQKAMKVKSKNAVWKSLRALYKKGFVNRDFKPL